MTLPTKRQVVLAAAVLCFVPLAFLIGVESYYFTHMPAAPMLATAQVVGVLVNHRVVYVTQGQFQFLSRTILICGLLVVLGGSILLAAYSHYRATRK
jgi:hypothetical protein